NPVLPDITLYDAINFAAQTWKNVTAGTIIRSWDRASILFSIIFMPEETRLDVLLSKKTELNVFMLGETELEEEIIDLIQHLPIDNPIDAYEYINIDNYINIKEDLSIDNIIDIINRQNESESEKEQNEEMIKIGDAIVGLNKVIKYIQQNDLEITLSLMKDLYSLKKYINYLHNESRRQTTLKEFINLMV
ncbi:17439_t:CDS:1, partial [Cetraspora pellucida]